MDAFSDHSEHQFFDALEEISEFSDFDCDNSEDFATNFSSKCCDSHASSYQFDVWIQNLESIGTRRSRFFNWLGLELDVNKSCDKDENRCDFDGEINEIVRCDEDVLRCNRSEIEFLSSRSTVACWPVDVYDISSNLTSMANFEGMESKVGCCNSQSEPDTSAMTEQSGCCSSSSSSSGEFAYVENASVNHSMGSTKGVKKWWLNRLRSFSCVVEGGEELFSFDSPSETKIQRVKVHQYKKQSKDISALYHGQNIQAHKGAILTMKFSYDGRYLASAGEDAIVRIWQVIEYDRSSEYDIPELDPSCVYFTVNCASELKPLSLDKGENGKLRRTSDSACVILPPKVFRISEKPLHEFQGHTSEILDISWSKDNFLLSSATDKTVRLWQIGTDHCLKVFPHNNYVTCVQFNPVDDNYFISGSIDGKVRVWEISHCKVVNWTGIKDMVTAVCYCPDGQGGIIGSITGTCHFFNISDNQLRPDAQILLHNKKKSSGKRITGFQFFPQDPNKVMVSCADSQVRIIQGLNVIGKYKGFRSSGSYCPAFFTSDGNHIVSASEDSNVYIWKCTNQDIGVRSQIKKVNSSERFLSNASVAVPWPGLPNMSNGTRWLTSAFKGLTHGARSFFSPVHFSCGQDYILESFNPKGSALWPEEKLVTLNPKSITSSMHKSEYKFLRTCQRSLDSNVWGLVIVTAGWDGCIRSFHNYGLPVPLELSI